jgi:ATP-dependent helicase/nuclease subunit A
MIKWTNAQREVIDAKHDNLAISASAGAGKTSVMIAKIKKLLDDGVNFDSILVLTFTEESARDMAARVTQTPALNIGTFHKFCHDLIKQYFSLAGVSPTFAILDDGTAKKLSNNILDDLTEELCDKCPDVINAYCSIYGNSSLKKIIQDIAEFLNWQQDGWIKNCAFNGYEKDNAFKIIKNHFNIAGNYFMSAFSPDMDCFAWAEKLANVKSYNDLNDIAKTFTKLKPMKKESEYYAAKESLNDTLKKLREQYILDFDTVLKNQDADKKLVEQIIIFLTEYTTRYAKEKIKRNFLDFADLEQYAVKILSDPETGKRIREKYKYIFADEYQDTNPVQEKILNLLSGESKVFTVGDLKQSIYAFRGTSAEVFLKRLECGKVIYLNENFRSGENILKFVNSVFSKIMKKDTAGIDYEKTSLLASGIKGGQVEIVAIKDGESQHEAAYIANEIVNLLKSGTSPKDIAVLSRSRTHFDVLQKTFYAANIPYITAKDVSANDLYEIALLNNVVLLSNDPNYELAKILLNESFAFDQKPLNLEKYNTIAKEKDVYTLLTIFIAEYDIINRLLITPMGEAKVQNIYTFLNKLRGASYASTAAQYAYMLLNGELDIKISVGGGDNAVKVMTIHGAKGLEFNTVFLYNAGMKFSTEARKKMIMLDKDLGICVYSNADEFKKRMSLARLASTIAEKKDQIAEEMRLLYVALTRAKQRLYIIGSGEEYEQKSLTDFEILNSNCYFDFIRPKDTINADEIPLPKVLQQNILTVAPNLETVKTMQERFLRASNYPYKIAIDLPQKTTVTSLTSIEEQYADQPLKSPYAKDRGTEYGTLFHLAMQTGEYFDDATKLCAQITNDFVKGMKTAREVVVYETVEIEGEKILVQGVIDLLTLDKTRAIIIDYKTTHAPIPRLIELYRPQLCAYAAAVSRATGLLTETYIYSTVHKQIIAL